MEFKNNKSGITLVALIITIVILLILAGVAIGAITGENGLIMRAEQAKKVTIYKEAKEKINLELMEIQAECTEQRKEYNIKEIALKMKDVEEITINKTYNKEIASLSEGIQIDEENVEAIVVSVDKYSEYKFLIGKSTKIEGVLEIQELDTTAKSDFIDIETFEKNLLKSIEKQSNIEFSYEVKERIENKVKVSIHIQDKENGIAKIEFPDVTIECFGRKEYAKDNYEVELGKEYKVKITSKSGETKEEKILIEDYWYNVTKNLGENVEIDNTATKAAYNKPYEATLSSQENGVILSLKVTMGGEVVTTAGNNIIDRSTGKIYIEKVTGDIEITATEGNRLYLYKEGDMCEEITGGYERYPMIYPTSGQGYGTAIIGEDGGLTITQTSGGNFNYGTKNAIDTSGFSKIYLDGILTKASSNSAIRFTYNKTGSTSNWDFMAQQFTIHITNNANPDKDNFLLNERKNLGFNLNQYTEKVYMLFSVYADVFKVYNVYLEK